MKVGIRKPSVKRSISARTTGKAKRYIKKSVNPLYGKKGMGLVNNPKKAAYNAVYNRTTASVKDVYRAVDGAQDGRSSGIRSALKWIGIVVLVLIVLAVVL